MKLFNESSLTVKQNFKKMKKSVLLLTLFLLFAWAIKAQDTVQAIQPQVKSLHPPTMVSYQEFRAKHHIPAGNRPSPAADRQVIEQGPIQAPTDIKPAVAASQKMASDCQYPPIEGPEMLYTHYQGGNRISQYDFTNSSYTVTVYAPTPGTTISPRPSVAIENASIMAFVSNDNAYLYDLEANDLTLLDLPNNWQNIALNPWGDMAVLTSKLTSQRSKIFLYDLSNPTAPSLITTFDITLPDGNIQSPMDHMEWSPSGQNIAFNAKRNNKWNMYFMQVWNNQTNSVGTGASAISYYTGQSSSVDLLHPTYARTHPGVIAYDQVSSNNSKIYTQSLVNPSQTSVVRSLTLSIFCSEVYGWPSFAPDDRGIAGLVYAQDCNGIPFNFNTWCGPKVVTWGLQPNGITPNGCMSTPPNALKGNAPLWIGKGGRTWSAPVASFSPTAAQFIDVGESVAFEYSGTECGTSYYWEFEGGTPATSNSLTPPAVKYSNTGIYSVKLTVKNPEGEAVEARQDHVHVGNTTPPSTTNLMAGAVEGAPGDTVLIPVYMTGCSELSSVQGVLTLEMPDVAQIEGVVPAKIDPIWAAIADGKVSFSWFGSKTITDTTVLFWVEAILDGTPGSQSIINFTNGAVLSIEVSCSGDLVNAGILTGLIKILAEAKITVSAETCDGESIGKTLVTVTSFHNGAESVLTATTPATGQWTTPGMPAGSDAIITLNKETNQYNGLSSAYWLLQMQRWMLGQANTQITDPCQVIAADYNGNKVVSSFDLFQMANAAVDTAGGPYPHKSWLFIPKTHVFPSPFTNLNVFNFPEAYSVSALTQDTEAGFWGIKVGDIGMNADPQNKAPEGTTQGQANVMEVLAQPQFDEASGLMYVDIMPQNLVNMSSFQAEIRFDPSLFKLIALEPQAIMPVYHITSGALRTLWYDSEDVSIHTGQPIFRIVMEPLGATNPALLSPDWLWLNETGTLNPELSTAKGQLFELGLTLNNATSNTSLLEQNAGMKGLSIVPNPANSEINIHAVLMEAQEVEVSVFDIAGRLMLQKHTQWSEGPNALSLDSSKWPVGTYSCRVTTQQQSSIIRVLVAH
jgi:PKD repeat protein